MLVRACACVHTDEAPAAWHSSRGQAELICSAIGNECVLLYQHNKTRLILTYSYIKKNGEIKMNKQEAESSRLHRCVGLELRNSQLHGRPGSPCCLQLCPPPWSSPQRSCVSPGLGGESERAASCLLIPC